MKQKKEESRMHKEKTNYMKNNNAPKRKPEGKHTGEENSTGKTVFGGKHLAKKNLGGEDFNKIRF